MADTKDWMTIEDALEHLKMSRTALYRAIDAGKIERQTVLGAPALRRSHVMKYQRREYNRKPTSGEGTAGKGAKKRAKGDRWDTYAGLLRVASAEEQSAAVEFLNKLLGVKGTPDA